MILFSRKLSELVGW
jgi:ATP-binding cassette, subfamily D (ALD), member 3